MQNLAGYIHKLMLEHDCVSIPNFGGMVAQRFRAEINPGTNIMRPPSKRISYHKDLVANSHLLLQTVMENNGLTQAKASEQIAATVATWKAQLQSGNSIKLDGVGRFYLDKEGAICFNQSLESNFDLDAFGLELFRATAIRRDVELKESVTVAIAETVKNTSQRFPYWRAAAVFVGIGALLAIGFFKTDFSVQNTLKTSFNPLHYSRVIELPVAVEEVLLPKTEKPVAKAPTVVPEIEPLAEEIVAEIAPEKSPAVAEIASDLKPYHVIVGSFKEAVYATELLSSLQKQGYNPVLINENSGFSKVSIEGFTTRAEAVQAMRAYQLSAHKSAWIYTR